MAWARVVGFTVAVSVGFVPAVRAQADNLPRLLPVPEARSNATFGAVAAALPLDGGRFLVNDSRAHRVVVMDSTFKIVNVAIDSGAAAYGRAPAAIIPWRGDSVLFISSSGVAATVVNPDGLAGRSMAFPAPRYAAAAIRATYGVVSTGAPGFDQSQRLYLPGTAAIAPYVRPTPANRTTMMTSADSAPLLRLDFATRHIDTAAFYRVPMSRTILESDDDGRVRARPEMTPPVMLDEWAVLSSGDIAILRGQDYRLDVVEQSGTIRRGAKLSFPWQRLDDDAKVAVLDSMKRAVQAENDSAGGHAMGSAISSAPRASGAALPTRVDSTKATQTAVDPMLNFTTVDRMADYRAPFLRGAMLADLEGDVWVRTTIVGRKGWGAVYDVIAANGQLIDRLQLPAGRRVVGFGRRGVVVLAAGDGGEPEWIERVRWRRPTG